MSFCYQPNKVGRKSKESRKKESVRWPGDSFDKHDKDLLIWYIKQALDAFHLDHG